MSDESSDESGLELFSNREVSTVAANTTLIIEKAKIERSVLEELFPERYKGQIKEKRQLK